MSETNENFGGVISVDTTGVSLPQPVATIDATAQVEQPIVAPVPEPAVPCQVQDIYAYVKETASVTSGNSGNFDEFVVDVYISVGCGDKNGVVKKRLSFSKNRLLADMQVADMSTPVAIVEEKQVQEKAVEEPKRSTAQRMRELAGIPHPKNWT